MPKRMLSLQNRLTLTYGLFISLFLAVLSVVVNLCTGVFFSALVKDNIAEKSREIVRAVGDQFNLMNRRFDELSVEAIGMYFAHEGYIVTVEDAEGGIVWDARSCDMEECAQVINAISARMEDVFGGKGSVQRQSFPVLHRGFAAGTVTIETFGPFFYSETESRFLASINRLLVMAGLVFILLSIIVSTLLSRSIARPVLNAAEAARKIALVHAGGNNDGGAAVVRLRDTYTTRELHGLAQSINELATKLEEAERRQKQLTSDIAHELRTPLTCLQGGIEAMIDGVYQCDKPHLESCHEEILRLTRLVDDLQTLTGLEWETLQLNKTDFDLAQLLRVTADQFAAAAHEKGIGITLCLQEAPITADYDRLKQVFINLLSNAVKYTDSGGITITVEGGPHRVVSIADTGIGIPENELPRLFERFYRADKSRSRSTGGSGIGLTIAAAIVAAHGGRICATSGGAAGNGSQGSVFRVYL